MPTEPPKTMTVSHALHTVKDIFLPENWEWQESDTSIVLIPNSSITATAEYIGTDGQIDPCEITISVDSHMGGTATCTKKAVCDICSEP